MPALAAPNRVWVSAKGKKRAKRNPAEYRRDAGRISPLHDGPERADITARVLIQEFATRYRRFPGDCRVTPGSLRNQLADEFGREIPHRCHLTDREMPLLERARFDVIDTSAETESSARRRYDSQSIRTAFWPGRSCRLDNHNRTGRCAVRSAQDR